MNDLPKASGFFVRGGVWVLVQCVLMTANILLVVVLHGDWSRTALLVVGASLLTLGGVFGLAGVAVLGRNRTAFPKPRDDSQLIQSGIYASVRHPLYTSVMLASVGWALLWQSWPSLIPAAWLIPFFFLKARREERWLREKFPGYADYAKRVPRFLPRFRAAGQANL